jgi:hypothetical protein
MAKGAGIKEVHTTNTSEGLKQLLEDKKVGS